MVSGAAQCSSAACALFVPWLWTAALDQTVAWAPPVRQQAAQAQLPTNPSPSRLRGFVCWLWCVVVSRGRVGFRFEAPPAAAHPPRGTEQAEETAAPGGRDPARALSSLSVLSAPSGCL